MTGLMTAYPLCSYYGTVVYVIAPRASLPNSDSDASNQTTGGSA
jgi:hypothetical protein